MYTVMNRFWRHAQEHAHACGRHCGPSGVELDARWAMGDQESELGGGAFGVRRPLRFLAYKLDLDDAQVAELAAILSDLKTERAQAAVDYRRSTSAFADAVSGTQFDAARVAAIANERVKTAERLRDAVVRALERIHALLETEQRTKFAYLIRTGAIVI
jgi:Spy/CpxP family protein refolding chaperone